MEYMEEKASEQIEAGIHTFEEMSKRISELESAMQEFIDSDSVEDFILHSWDGGKVLKFYRNKFKQLLNKK